MPSKNVSAKAKKNNDQPVKANGQVANESFVDYDKKILEVKNLRQYFKVGVGRNKIIVKAVDDVSFDIYSKEVFGLVGESGSGKTTAGRTIINLYKATGGKVIYRGDTITYGTDSIYYDIKQLKKSHRLEIMLQSPVKKALYDLKQENKQANRNFDMLVKKTNHEFDAKIATVNEPIGNYDDEILSINRERNLALADLEKNIHAQKNEIELSRYKTLAKEQNDYLVAAKIRFAKKRSYLKDAKLDIEPRTIQFNSFLNQFVEEVAFSYDVLMRKVGDDKTLMSQVARNHLYKKGAKVIAKFEKNKLINEQNLALIKQKVDTLNKLEADQIGTIPTISPAEQEKTNKEKLQKVSEALKEQSDKINAEYDEKITKVSQPNNDEINKQVLAINTDRNKVLKDISEQKSQSNVAYKEKVAQTQKDEKLKAIPIDEEKIKQLNADFDDKLAKLYEELEYAKGVSKLRETPQAKKERKIILAQLKEKNKLDIAAATNDEQKEKINSRYLKDVDAIQKRVLSYKNIITSMQMIFQDPISSLNPRMTVREIIGEGLIIKGLRDKKEIEKRVFEVLQLVGLQSSHADRYPHEFSGGQRQRIGIARALIINPEFIIADEPISALDVSIQAQIINLLNDLKKRLGLTILFVAHDLSVVRYFSDRIAVMFKGKIVELAPAKELFDNPLHPYTKSLLSAIPKPDPDSESDRQRVIYDPAIHHYYVDKPQMVEITPGHFIYANQEEIDAYRIELKENKK